MIERSLFQGGVRKICIPLHKDDTSTNRDECAIVQSCTHE